MVRLARSFSAAFRPMAAFCWAVRASVKATVVMLLVLASCCARSRGRLGGIESDLRLLQRHLLVGIVEADEGLALGDLGTGRKVQFDDDAAVLGIEGHLLRRGDRADGAHVNARIVDADRRVTTRTGPPRPPAKPLAAWPTAASTAALPGSGRRAAAALLHGEPAVIVGVPPGGGDQHDDEGEDDLSGGGHQGTGSWVETELS